MEDLDPSKFHVMTPKMRKNLTIAVAVFVIVIFPILTFQYYRFAINRPAQGFKETTFEISQGEAISSVSRRLYTANLVNSAFLFKFYLLTSGRHTGIQAGVYNIPAGASIVQLGEIFQYGTNDRRVTFQEGLRVEEVAILAAENFSKVDYEKFVSVGRAKEGYLFPDTYFFHVNSTEEEIIDRMSQTFDLKTEDLLSEENLTAAKMTREEVIIFASIVEREVAEPTDRPIVAGILIDRWRNGELLGADATTQYISAIFNVCGEIEPVGCPSADQAMNMEWWPRDLSNEDLDLESPYNTRKVAGLPPAPISNPGVDAIDSVIHAKFTPYNYYLTDKDGVTHYAVTIDEHLENQAKFL
jgi:UPF0755 protein